jgi:peptidoglycan-associated lipoprotein
MTRFEGSLFVMALAGALASGCSHKVTSVVAAPAPEADDAAASASQAITEAELDTLQANFNKVHFGFDRADLDAGSRSILAENAAILAAHPDVQIRVEGHADRWGSDLYNLALGQRRADAVRRYLEDYGVAPDQLKVISYGEERPLVGEADAEAEAPNRRAEFLVIVGGEVARSSY